MKIKKIGVSFVVTFLLIALSLTQVFAAELGEHLLQPESGWERHDILETENFIISEGVTVHRGYTGAWNDTLVVSQSSNETVKFKFKGTKIRIIGYARADRADDVSISIDGMTESMPNHKNAANGPQQALIYENIGLENSAHEVTINSGSTGNGTYSLVIDAIDIDEGGELINLTIAIEPPTNLVATAGDEEADLSWDEVEDADSYIIKRSKTEGGPYITIDEDVTKTNFTDTDVKNDTTYYYVVSAVVDGEESSDSNEASATPEGSSSGDRALLRIIMVNGKVNEYDLSMDDVDDFIDWYEDRDDNRGEVYYIIEKDYNVGPFTSRKDYIIADKILQFEIMEYED